MGFKLWYEEQETGLNGGFPEAGIANQTDTPASNMVKLTGLQPQVDSPQDIDPKSMADQDKVGAIDADLERLQLAYKEKSANKGSRLNTFRNMLDSFIKQWNSAKMDRGEPKEDSEGLGQTMGDMNFRAMMQKHMNAVPGAPQVPNGPGTFGG